MKPSFLMLVLFLLLNSFGCVKESLRCQSPESSCDSTQITQDSSKAGRKVLIIGIDGFRSDALQSHISPFLKEMSGWPSTYFTDKNVVERNTVSGPNWTSLLTGVHQCKHGVKGNDFKNEKLNEYPHFFYFLEQPEDKFKTISIVNWLPINQQILYSSADYAPENSINDQEVFQLAKEVLENGSPMYPDVLFLHFDELDGAGHQFGFSPEVPEYAETLSQIDVYIEGLFGIIDEKRQSGEDWAIFIVSDHGGDKRGHGGGRNNAHINQTIFFAQHPEQPFAKSHITRQVDLVPSVLDFLGVFSEEQICKTDGVSILR